MNIKIQSCNTTHEQLVSDIKNIYEICCAEDSMENPFFIDQETSDFQIPTLYYASIDSKIVGFISSYILDDENAEVCCYVLPEYRRKRIATLLFDTLLADYEDYAIYVSLLGNNLIGKSFLSAYEFEYESTECKMSLNLSEYNPANSLHIQLNAIELTKIIKDNSTSFHGHYKGEVIGSCMVYPCDKASIIHDVIVFNEFRNQGYGYALVSKVLTELSHDYEKVILHVTKENIPAYKLYSKLGFSVTNELEYYKV